MQLKKELLEWYNSQLLDKNIVIASLEELSNGYHFLQLIHNFHPKSVDLSKVYILPKNQYEVLQNYKILSTTFVKLGWKKFDPERYSKRKEKDYLSLAQVLRKILSTRSMKESSLHNNIDTTLQQFRGEQETQQKSRGNQKRYLKIIQLQKTKKLLLQKIMKIQQQISRQQEGQQGQLIQSLRNRINEILNSQNNNIN